MIERIKWWVSNIWDNWLKNHDNRVREVWIFSTIFMLVFIGYWVKTDGNADVFFVFKKSIGYYFVGYLANGVGYRMQKQWQEETRLTEMKRIANEEQKIL